jgi:hypothetical protein
MNPGRVSRPKDLPHPPDMSLAYRVEDEDEDEEEQLLLRIEQDAVVDDNDEVIFSITGYVCDQGLTRFRE